MTDPSCLIRPCRPDDAETLVNLVRELAVYEKLEDAARATADDFRTHLFGPRPTAEAFVAEVDGRVVGFALIFATFSTFRGQPGMYLEDLFVRPEYRGGGSARPCWRRWHGWRSIAVAGGSNGRCSTGMPRRSASTGPWGPSRWTSGRSTGSATSRCPASPPWRPPSSRRPLANEPRLPAPHRADGRLRAGRAAPRRRIHQAQHEREPVSPVAARRRGDRRALDGRLDSTPTRSARSSGGSRRGCTASSRR